ncbi:Hypothetical protein POVN_LOCUS255, partial [uncultured virus]
VEEPDQAPFLAVTTNGDWFNLWGSANYIFAGNVTGAGLLNSGQVTASKQRSLLNFPPPGLEIDPTVSVGVWSSQLRYNGANGDSTGQSFSGAVLPRFDPLTDDIKVAFKGAYQFTSPITANSTFSPLSFTSSGRLRNQSTFATGFEAFFLFGPSPITNAIPPDPVGAAGPELMIVVVNRGIGIYNKTTGEALVQLPLGGPGGFFGTSGLLGAIGQTTPTGSVDNVFISDPWIEYDHHNGRFVVTCFDIQPLPNTSNIYFAVSTNSNPTTGGDADWYKYVFIGNKTSTAGNPTFPDYLKFGYDTTNYWLTANDFDRVTGAYVGVSLRCIQKAEVIVGAPAFIRFDSIITFMSPRPFSLHPMTVYDSNSPQDMYFADVLGSPNIRVLAMRATGPTSFSFAFAFLTVNPFVYVSSDVPQPDPAFAPIDTFDGRFMSGCVRNGILYTSHGIFDPAFAPRNVVTRWYSIDVSLFVASGPLGPLTLLQQGTIPSGPSDNLWMSHIQVDAFNNMGISFSVGGVNRYASIGYTGRLSTDPPNTVRPFVIGKPGLDNYQRLDGSGRNRWGDYSGLAMDPNGTTFWIYHEYAGVRSNTSAPPNNGIWRTRVIPFDLNGTTSFTFANSMSVVNTATLTSTPVIGSPSALDLMLEDNLALWESLSAEEEDVSLILNVLVSPGTTTGTV